MAHLVLREILILSFETASIVLLSCWLIATLDLQYNQSSYCSITNYAGQLNTAGFSAAFVTATVITRMACYREWGGQWGRVGSWRRVKVTTKTQTAMLCVQQVTQTVLIHRTGRDSRQLQFGTTHSLINAIQWLHRTSSAPTWFDRLEKIHL